MDLPKPYQNPELYILIKEPNFLKPGTYSASKIKPNSVIYKIRNSSMVKQLSTTEWQNPAENFQSAKVGLISPSTNLSLFFAHSDTKQENPTVLLKNSSFTPNKSQKPRNLSPENQKKILKPAKAQEVSLIEPPTLLVNELASQSLSEVSNSIIFSKIKPSFKVKKMKKNQSVKDLANLKASEYINTQKVMHQRRVIRTTVPAKRLQCKNAETKFKTDSDINFPELQTPIRRLPEKETGDKGVCSKTLMNLKDLPLYRISVENNVFLKLRNYKGKLNP